MMSEKSAIPKTTPMLKTPIPNNNPPKEVIPSEAVNKINNSSLLANP